MNLARLSDAEMLNVKKNLLRGYGEIVPYKWVDIEAREVEVEAEEGAPKKRGKKEYIEVPVERTNEYYIGKMTLFQTTGVIAVLGAIFVNGSNFKAETERQDNIAFLEFLDEYHLGVLVSIITGESRDWLTENWDVVEILRIIKTFFKYNDFFSLLREVGTLGQGMGLTEEKARMVALGQASLLAG